MTVAAGPLQFRRGIWYVAGFFIDMSCLGSTVSQPELPRRAADTPSEELSEILKREGCVILEDFLSKAQVEAILSDLEPFIGSSSKSRSDFAGHKTTRTGALMARSPRCRELAIDPRIIGLVENFLAPYANTVQLHVTQAICLLPGEKEQDPHRDRWAWSQLQSATDAELPVNKLIARLFSEIEPQVNTMLALTDFTRENGATRIAPGSTQLPDDAPPPDEAFVSAEMAPGSILFFSGSVFHGAGANSSDGERIGLNIDYTLGWLRQEDNQYLSCPPEIAKSLDPKLQALLGYAVGGPSLGYFTPPLPVGEDLSAPGRLFRGGSRSLRLDADGRPEFVDD